MEQQESLALFPKAVTNAFYYSLKYTSHSSKKTIIKP